MFYDMFYNRLQMGLEEESIRFPQTGRKVCILRATSGRRFPFWILQEVRKNTMILRRRHWRQILDFARRPGRTL